MTAVLLILSEHEDTCCRGQNPEVICCAVQGSPLVRQCGFARPGGLLEPAVWCASFQVLLC